MKKPVVIVLAVLAEKGFKRIKNVEGGLLNWAGPVTR